MNKTTKTIVATTVAFGTLFGVGTASGVSAQNNVAHAATTPYYTYHGYAGNDASFLLNKQFIDGIKYNNVTFNGVKLAENQGSETLTKYDQDFSGVSKDQKKANAVGFKVKSKLTVQQLKTAYGSGLSEMQTSEKANDIYVYRPSQDGEAIMFQTDGNNNIERVSIGYGLGAGG
ncbi:immunodominant staphylococcal antigen IsaB family protein [Staphylococcus kloosii]|jgi:hypothetical protein|uniref:Immunodominant staphylococcal antigen B n=1 Tax=Staphylococcus kloosii TaxID=29384 RepID=A0A151A3S7_9STAP|nr:hypothetical protein [Staphylococcus kloosii]KYH14038.1 hypothetical protein A0131_04385 [Staphylococcus kloosii]